MRLGVLIVVGVLAAAHVAMALLPKPPFTHAFNLVLFATNLYVLHCASTILAWRPASHVALFFLGYAIIFFLAMVLLGAKPLFILCIVVYASVFGSPVLLGIFALFVLSFVLLQPYAFETFVPLAFVYAVLLKARHSASRFGLVCLLTGLLGLSAVLFPIVHLAMRDSAQTLAYVFGRAEVRSAIGTSLVSATVATVLCALFGIPLAYALARLDFAGKRTVEALVDMPILIPQSVAGVALVSLLGPGSALGDGLAQMGLGVSGTMAGLVIAQVFVASPFLVKTAMTAFEGVPLELEQASRVLGHSALATFARITLPLASRGILVGAGLAWARAVSEFGTVLIFAPSPVSGPLLVHTEFLRAGVAEARPIATLLLFTCLWVFVFLRVGEVVMPLVTKRRDGEA